MNYSKESTKKIQNHKKYIAISICVICSALLAIYLKYDAFSQKSEKNVSKEKILCKDCNIVLITLDVCSAKNIPCYGYSRNTTPNLCAFAKENQLFVNSFANATWTLPSHVSMFTGLLPTHHRIRSASDPLEKSIPFLPEILQQNGYETILLQDKDSISTPYQIYNRGASIIEPDFTIDGIFSRLDENAKKGKKSFISYYNSDCHEPNLVGSAKKLFTKDSFPMIPIEPGNAWQQFTPEFLAYLQEKIPHMIENNGFGPDTKYVEQFWNRIKKATTFEESKKIFYEQLPDTAETLKYNMFWSYVYEKYIDVKNIRLMTYLRALYDQQFFDIDSTIIRDFVHKLSLSEQKNSTIVIITSEHGQEFGEHGVFGHTTLYEPNVRVPFILAIPGMRSSKHINTVQGIDIPPTILDIIGIRSKFQFDGHSVVPHLTNTAESNDLVVTDSDSGDTFSVRKGSWKVLVAKDNESRFVPYELYNTDADPEEVHNLLLSNFQIAHDLIDAYKKQYE